MSVMGESRSLGIFILYARNKATNGDEIISFVFPMEQEKQNWSPRLLS